MSRENNKADQKASAAAANDERVYEETPFGRRRISSMPEWLANLVRLVCTPTLFIYRRLCGSRPSR
jgi:hypothetical protein